MGRVLAGRPLVVELGRRGGLSADDRCTAASAAAGGEKGSARNLPVVGKCLPSFPPASWLFLRALCLAPGRREVQ